MSIAALFVAVPGTVTPVIRLNLDCPAFLVQNDSLFDIWVKVGGEPPALAPTGTIATSSYDWPILAGCHEPVYTPQPFDGNVYCGCFNPAGSASSGTSSKRANVYITPLAPGQPVPDGFAVPRSIDLSSQPRVIAIPLVATAVSIGLQLTAIGSLAYAQYGASWVSDGVTVHSTSMYVYSILLSMYGVRRARFTALVGQYDLTAGGTLIENDISNAVVFSGEGPREIVGSYPDGIKMTTTPGSEVVGHTYAWIVGLQLSTSQPVVSASIPLFMFGVIRADMDASAQVTPPTIGNGAATASGVLY